MKYCLSWLLLGISGSLFAIHTNNRSLLTDTVAPYLQALDCSNSVNSVTDVLIQTQEQLADTQELLFTTESLLDETLSDLDDAGSIIDAAKALVNQPSIPYASEIDFAVSSMFGYTPTTIDSLATDPLVPRIEDGLIPYLYAALQKLYAALQKLGDYNKIVKIVGGGDWSNGGHMLVLTSAGKVYGTGVNYDGQLGLGDSDNRYVLTPLIGEASSGVTDIAAGLYHSIIVKNGKAYATGYNFYGALGSGKSGDDDGLEYEYSTTFLPMIGEGTSGVTGIAGGGYHTLVLKGDKVYATGAGSNGELGTGNDVQTTATLTPMIGEGASGVIAIAAGEFHSLILKDTGAVYGCGIATRLGIGPVGSSEIRLTPTAMIGAGENDVVAIAAGTEYSVVLKNDGSVWGTGRNNMGQLGIGNTDNYVYTLTVMLGEGQSGVDSISCGQEHTIVLKGDKAYACGDNYYGELGIGTDSSSGDDYRTTLTAMIQEGSFGVTSILAVGGSFSVVLKDDNRIYGAGSNQFGELGLGEFITSTALLTKIPPKYLPIV